MLRYALIGGVAGAIAGITYAALRSAAPSVVGGSGSGYRTPSKNVPPPPGGRPTPLPKQECPGAGVSVVVVGDSYAEGLIPYLKSHADKCGTPFQSSSKVGSSVVQWDSWIDQHLGGGVNVVLISLGGNDFKRDPAQLKAAIGSMVGKIRDSGARPLWISPLKLPYTDSAGVRDMWKATVSLDDWYPSEEEDYPRAPDGIHLYPSGYKAWAANVWPWMAARVSTGNSVYV